MEEETVITPEATVVEAEDSSVQNVQQQEINVVESPTPMDNNVTYDNITEDVTPTFDNSKTFGQNILQQAVQSSYQTNLDANTGTAMDQFLNKDYSYDKNEAGTYWVAGAINDVDTQMSFLNTLIREDMYDEMDLQKYYYDSTMATARAYAAQKKKETAYGFYRAAQEKAIAEASLTGWYMPAEGNYMLGQYTVAQNVLENPEAPVEDKARAQRISGTVEKWFNANQIGTRGIKCLNMMNYEENVRHNTIMGELQKQANQIAGAGNAVNAALADINLREFKFQVEELELQYGFNFTKDIGLNNDNYLGHDVANDPDYIKYQALKGGDSLNALTKDWKLFSAILGSSNIEWMKQALGENNYEKAYQNYQAGLGDQAKAESLKVNGNILSTEALNPTERTLSEGEYKGNKLSYFTDHDENGNPVTRVYAVGPNGSIQQITDKDAKLDNGKTVGEIYSNFTGDPLTTKDGKIIKVGGYFDYNGMDSPFNPDNLKNFKKFTDDNRKVIEEKQKEGYKMEFATFDTQGKNSKIVMSKYDPESGTTKYYSVKGDKFQEITKPNEMRFLTIDGDVGTEILKYEAGDWGPTSDYLQRYNTHDGITERDIHGNVLNGKGTNHYGYIVEQLQENEDGTYSYYNPDGTEIILKREKTGRTGDYGTEYKLTVVDKKAPSNSVQSYMNGYIETKAVKNSETLMQEDLEKSKNNQSYKNPKIKSEASGGANPSKVDTNNRDTSNYTNVHMIEKQNVDTLDNEEYFDKFSPLNIDEEYMKKNNINNVKVV